MAVPRAQAVNGGAAGPRLQNKGLAARGAAAVAAAGACRVPCRWSANGRNASRAVRGARRGRGRMGAAGWGSERRAAVSTGGPRSRGSPTRLRGWPGRIVSGSLGAWVGKRAEPARSLGPWGCLPCPPPSAPTRAPPFGRPAPHPAREEFDVSGGFPYFIYFIYFDKGQ